MLHSRLVGSSSSDSSNFTVYAGYWKTCKLSGRTKAEHKLISKAENKAQKKENKKAFWEDS